LNLILVMLILYGKTLDVLSLLLRSLMHILFF